MQQRIAGGIVVAMFLVIASDFDATAQLAVAFAYLILISSLLVVGPAAFENLSRMVGSTRTVTTNPDGSRVAGGTW
jgi:hypothetical protein